MASLADNLIMRDNSSDAPPIGHQIRLLRRERGLTLAGLTGRAGTSGPSLHRYENGWDRFQIETLRRIAAALDARLELRLIPTRPLATQRPPSRRALIRRIGPLFWDRDLRETDVSRYSGWVLERVLTAGNRAQVRAARAYFGDAALRRAIERRGVDPRTRQYWRLILGKSDHAPESS